MCLLSVFTPGVQPDPEHLENGCKHNRDGYGYAIITGTGRKNRRLLVSKSLHYQGLIEQFTKERARHPEGPALFHSRMATGGKRDVGNCHPFRVGRDRNTVLAHNGVLFRVPHGEDRSDTRIFAEDKFPQQYRRLDRQAEGADGVRRYTVLEQMATSVSSYNKIAILTANPRYEQSLYMVNFDQGWWLGEDYESAWHSNRDYLGYKRYYGGTGYLSGPSRLGTTGFTPVPVTAGGYTSRESAVTSREYAWREPADDQCTLCFAKGGVDEVTGICMFCDSCTDCENDKQFCMCYQPSRIIPGVAGDGTKYGEDDSDDAAAETAGYRRPARVDGTPYTDADVAAIVARFDADINGTVTDTQLSAADR